MLMTVPAVYSHCWSASCFIVIPLFTTSSGYAWQHLQHLPTAHSTHIQVQIMQQAEKNYSETKTLTEAQLLGVIGVQSRETPW
jgi:hypothetical protein